VTCKDITLIGFGSRSPKATAKWVTLTTWPGRFNRCPQVSPRVAACRWCRQSGGQCQDYWLRRSSVTVWPCGRWPRTVSWSDRGVDQRVHTTSRWSVPALRWLSRSAGWTDRIDLAGDGHQDARPPFSIGRLCVTHRWRFRRLVVSKRTFQPNTRRRAKTHGFRLRMRTRAGRSVVASRRRKGRSNLSAW